MSNFLEVIIRFSDKRNTSPNTRRKPKIILIKESKYPLSLSCCLSSSFEIFFSSFYIKLSKVSESTLENDMYCSLDSSF